MTIEKVEEVMLTEENMKPEYPKSDKDLTEHVKAEVFKEEPKREQKETLSDTVKLKVLIGTLQFEDGLFHKGDVFEVSRERAERFDKNDVKIVG